MVAIVQQSCTGPTVGIKYLCKNDVYGSLTDIQTACMVSLSTHGCDLTDSNKRSDATYKPTCCNHFHQSTQVYIPESKSFYGNNHTCTYPYIANGEKCPALCEIWLY